MYLSLFAAFEWIGWLINPVNWPIVLAVAAGLGFVIFVHELGHFLVAKACGVKCEKFYLGFDIYGLKLCKFQWGETEYGVGILPLGGYVKMLGQDDNPARMAEETRRAQLKAEQAAAASAAESSNEPSTPAQAGAGDQRNDQPHGSSIAAAEHAPPLTHGDLPSEPVSDPHAPYDPRSYMAQSVPKRMAIISAGVIMNVIFAVIMAAVAYAIGVKEIPAIVGQVMAGGTAWKADLKPGDEIIRIGNLENPRFRDLQTKVPLSDVEKGIELEIKRPGTDQPFVIRLHPDDKSLGIPRLGIGNYAKTRLDEERPAFPNSAAAKAEPSLVGSDRIAQIDDHAVESYVDLLNQFAQHADETLHVTVRRPPAELLESPNDVENKEITKEEKEQRLDAAAKPAEIEVPATPFRDVGLVMSMGPITGVQKGSVAEEAGIRVGDVLLKIDGKPVGNPMTLPERMRAVAKRGDTVKLLIERVADGGKTTESVELKPRLAQCYYPSGLEVDPLAAAALGIAYHVQNKVTDIVPSSPAAKADIKPGDVVTRFQFLAPKDQQEIKDNEASPVEKDSNEIDLNEKTPAWPYLFFEVLPRLHPETKVKLWITRDGNEHTVELLPVAATLEDGTAWHVPERGFALQPVSYLHTAKSFVDALRLGGEETVDSLLLVYRFLQRIGQGKISLKMTAGPVGIAQMAGMKVKEGFSSFLLFLTMLSANLAVINFLPIPVLDGGHMVFLLYEGIRGKPASERVIIAFTYAGLIFLLSLMAFVLLLDIGAISRR